MQSRKQLIQKNVEMLKKDEVVEIRILRTPQGTVAGYFNDYEALAGSVQEYIGKHDIFMSLNQLNLDLVGKTSNTLQNHARTTTSDIDITRLKYILIDLDPVRPAGISATDEEKKYAADLMQEIVNFLSSKEINSCIKTDSGNGYHILLPIDLENTKENVATIKEFLRVLDMKFSNEKVEVDLTTYNPSRIVKLYGTIATKGENTIDRPHRTATILEKNQSFEAVDKGKIQAIVSLLPKKEVVKEQEYQEKDGAKFDVDSFIVRHNLKLSHRGEFHKEGTKYILDQCPWDENHTDRSAYIIQFNNGALAAGCHHNGCQGEDWKSLRERLGEPAVGYKGKGDNKEIKDEKQVDAIIKLASSFKYFKDDLEQHYVSISNGEYFDILPINSRRFKLFLLKQYRDTNGTTPGDTAVNGAVQVLMAEAEFSNQERKLQKRVAKFEDKYYYDLCNKKWGIIKIDEESVGMEENPPILFLRTKNMKEQLMPDFRAQPGELINLISKHFRLRNEDAKVILASYLVSCFVPDIAHPIIILHGEKGSGKSTTMKQIKRIVDPAIQDLLVLPQSNEDLAITLSNNYMPVFDNLDNLSAAKSDILCMASTGGAFTKRQLYADADETILSFKRCIGLNGINIVATRSDLLDRSILIELSRITREKRMTERSLWKDFEKDVPRFLGAIFNTLSQAIAVREELELEEVGRMADFDYWGYAIAEVLGIEGGGQTFQRAYLNNQGSATKEAIESHPIASAILKFMENREIWASSVTELLQNLQRVAVHHGIDTRDKLWARDANVLSRRLKEIKSNLDDVGIGYSIRHVGSHKQIEIENRRFKD